MVEIARITSPPQDVATAIVVTFDEKCEPPLTSSSFRENIGGEGRPREGTAFGDKSAMATQLVARVL